MRYHVRNIGHLCYIMGMLLHVLEYDVVEAGVPFVHSYYSKRCTYMRLYALEAVAPRELMSNAKPAAALPHSPCDTLWLRLLIMTPATT